MTIHKHIPSTISGVMHLEPKYILHFQILKCSLIGVPSRYAPLSGLHFVPCSVFISLQRSLIGVPCSVFNPPYLVYNEQGYSKHYYAGAERVSSRIGGGMQDALVNPLTFHLDHLSGHDNFAAIASDLWEMTQRSILCTDFNPENVSMEPHLHSVEHSQNIDDPENNRYIYHSDHLGSSSFLTDASGDPTQHLQYLPFGETFIEQRSITSYYTPYTFSAKERDTETGYSFFGARYYDADISVWLSVDPMADKYPYQSGYCYVGWRPLMVVDPNGMWEQDADGNWVARKGDSWWTLHEQSGMSWEETMTFAKDFNAAREKKNWKFVGVGDKVTLPGRNQKSTQDPVSWDLNSDGRFQKDEADSWWLNGGGVDVTVDNSNIDWTGLEIPTEARVGQTFSISTTEAFFKLPYETAATYGGTSFILRGAHTVEVVDQLYHYRLRPNNSVENIARNVMTQVGRPNGQGTDFMIRYINPLITVR